MSKDQNTGGTAKNRGTGAASEPASGTAGLNIPTLGASASVNPVRASAAGQILQPGESPDVLGAAGVGAAGEPGPAAVDNSSAVAAQPSMADIQRLADANTPVRGRQAMHQPAGIRRERYQEDASGTTTLEMPVAGSLDAMRRPDQYIEPIADLGRFRDKAAELAFLEEVLLIRIHETGDKNEEPIVRLGVNGRQVFIPRGREVFVRRKYVEQLLRARPESVSTRIERDGQGNPRNFIDKTRALKYPFSILRDDSPRGRAWEQRILAQA